MDKQKENERPVESDNSVENVSGMDDPQGKGFIEPLKEVEDEPIDTDIDQATEAGAENESDIQATDLDSPKEPLSEPEESSPESEEFQFESEETLTEKDAFSEPDMLADPLDENSEEADDTEKNIDEEKKDSLAEAVSQKDGGSNVADPEIESNVEITEPKTESSVDAADPEVDISSETVDLENANPDEDILTDDRAQGADQEASKNKSSTQNDSNDSAPTAVAETEKRKNLSKLAFSVVFILALIGVLLAYGHKWSFRSKQDELPPAVQMKEPNPVESPGKINKPQKHDPYKNYRDILNEVTELRKILLLKQQEGGQRA
jgi:hypothetical protein